MFANDRKKFFRNLDKEQISVEKPPKKKKQQNKFWCSILENNREYNHSAEWISICIYLYSIQQIGLYLHNYADTDYQPWEDISQDELQTALKKTSDWKSLGPDVFPNFWLKQLTTLHHHLL